MEENTILHLVHIQRVDGHKLPENSCNGGKGCATEGVEREKWWSFFSLNKNGPRLLAQEDDCDRSSRFSPENLNIQKNKTLCSHKREDKKLRTYVGC